MKNLLIYCFPGISIFRNRFKQILKTMPITSAETKMFLNPNKSKNDFNRKEN